MFLRGELSTVPADGTLWPSTLVRVLSRQRGGAGRLPARHLRGVERSSPQRLGCFQANVLASCSESHAVFAEDESDISRLLLDMKITGPDEIVESLTPRRSFWTPSSWT